MAMPAWVSEVGVAATVVVAFLAVWGEKVRAGILRPKLHLELRSHSGELTDHVLIDRATGNAIATEPARYFHLRLTNRTYFPAAHEVIVYLTRVERPGPNGEPQTLYETDLPLTWMHADLYKETRRTIGHSTVAFADLFFVTPNRLKLLPVQTPNNLPDTFQPDAHFWVTVVARGIDAQSNKLRLKVDWDGQWHIGQTEMQGHLIISVA